MIYLGGFQTNISRKDYWKILTTNDKKRSAILRGKGYDDVIDSMIENNCKLKQETVEIQSI